MADKVKGIEDLEELRAAASAQGTTVPNYNEWNTILKDLEEAGVESTGSYEGDRALHSEIQKTVEKFLEENKVEQANQQQQIQDEQPRAMSQSDNEQALKATFANATSSTIMSDYMKYYHLLM